jgi:hypothetical protein
LFRFVFANDFEVKHTATVDACSDKSRFFLIKVCEIYESDLQREGFDVVEMFVENMELEVC